MSFAAFFFVVAPLASVALIAVNRRWLRLAPADFVFLLVLVVLLVMFVGLRITPDVQPA